MEESFKFEVTDDQGRTVECEALFTFRSDRTGKDYIVYTNDELDEDGCTKVFAAVYTPGADPGRLLPIETEEEWEMIAHILAQLEQERGAPEV